MPNWFPTAANISCVQRVTRIINEKTGQMQEMKTPCIILESVFCQSPDTALSHVLPEKHLFVVAGDLAGEGNPGRADRSTWTRPKHSRCQPAGRTTSIQSISRSTSWTWDF